MNHYLHFRLEAYDRNHDFRGPAVEINQQVLPEWPYSGFKQLTVEHKILLPIITNGIVEAYFKYRMAGDSLSCGDIKALEKGGKLLEGLRIGACSIRVSVDDLYLTGLVGAAMKKKVSVSTCIYIYI